jgi:hypothetical protein
MTNNQEKLLRGRLSKWLSMRGEAPNEVDIKTNAWLQYFDGIKKPVVALAACKWLCSGAVNLPEDMPKVEQAVKAAELNHVDPLQFKQPMEIVDKFGAVEVKTPPINPDNVHTLHLNQTYDSGLAIYDVDESQESRENLRKIINTHFGKESSPWCLLQGDSQGNLTEDSRKYWGKYSSYPKQVAFVDGKLAAFSANDSYERVWWDRKDVSHKDVVFSKKVKGDPLNRSVTRNYNVSNGMVTSENIFRMKQDFVKEIYGAIESQAPNEIIFSFEFSPEHKKNIIGEFNIPEGVTRIGNDAFAYCGNVSKVHIPNSVTSIGDHAFENCENLIQVNIPANVSSIGFDTFSNCKCLTEIHIPENVSRIGSGAFSNCKSLTEIHIPENTKRIGGDAFMGCTKLKQINLPNSLVHIHANTFQDCVGLTEINIPDSVMKIERDAFKGCDNLKRIIVTDKFDLDRFDRDSIPNTCVIERAGENLFQDISLLDKDILYSLFSHDIVQKLEDKGNVSIDKIQYRARTEFDFDAKIPTTHIECNLAVSKGQSGKEVCILSKDGKTNLGPFKKFVDNAGKVLVGKIKTELGGSTSISRSRNLNIGKNAGLKI